MKPWQLLVIRLYMLTLGRLSFGAAVLRKALVLVLIKGKGGKGYHASSRFFHISDLDG